MKPKLVIFDLDGTLLDTIGDLGNAVNHAMAAHDWQAHTMEEYRKMVGHGIRNLVQTAMPDPQKLDESLVDIALKDFVEYYTAHIDVHTRPYEGVRDILSRLQAAGSELAIASNKFQTGTETLARRFFPDIRFCAIYGNREGQPLKPDAAIVRGAIAAAGNPEPESVVMVGDSATDMRTAANGGITGVGVGWGFRSKEEIMAAGASVVADTTDQLAKVLGI